MMDIFNYLTKFQKLYEIRDGDFYLEGNKVTALFPITDKDKINSLDKVPGGIDLRYDVTNDSMSIELSYSAEYKNPLSIDGVLHLCTFKTPIF